MRQNPFHNLLIYINLVNNTMYCPGFQMFSQSAHCCQTTRVATPLNHEQRNTSLYHSKG